MGWMDDDKEQKYGVFAKVFHFNWKIGTYIWDFKKFTIEYYILFYYIFLKRCFWITRSTISSRTNMFIVFLYLRQIPPYTN